MKTLRGSQALIRTPEGRLYCAMGNTWSHSRCQAAAPHAEPPTSLIPETLRNMEADTELQATLAAVQAQGQQQLTRAEAKARARSLQGMGLPSFTQKLKATGINPLRRDPCTTLQLNIGLLCNQACSHCHVESSPLRTAEVMDLQTVQRCLQLLAGSAATTLDITGGAPELNQHFRYLVQEARALNGDLEIIDRCNLTVLCEPGQTDTPEFLAKHRVRVVASLPCYGQDNVDKQRGKGVFERSIQGLHMLNAVGYGKPDSGLVLDLVYNPGGAFLAPPQSKLQPAYKDELKNYGIEFNSLLCLNNMPIKRFADWLLRNNTLSEYMALLVEAFNPTAVQHLMCHHTVSVAWNGRLYDCDFNQQLDLRMQGVASCADSAAVSAAAGNGAGGKVGSTKGVQQQQQEEEKGLTVWDIGSLDELSGSLIAVGSHCYGCTAGSGSSCGGATAS